MAARTRIYRRRGRNRKLKYTWKSAGHPTVRKRIGDGKQWYTQYNPCGCQQMCGKDCPCVENGTCCEKYCGYVRTSKLCLISLSIEQNSTVPLACLVISMSWH